MAQNQVQSSSQEQGSMKVCSSKGSLLSDSFLLESDVPTGFTCVLSTLARPLILRQLQNQKARSW